MKKSALQIAVMLIFTLAFQTIITATWAQVPQKISFQAVIRNNTDQLVTNQVVGMRISILQGSETGTVVYTETQKPATNANGLVTIEIGAGSTSDNFYVINWANGPYYIKTETDLSGGTNYTINGVSQLLSVPYALYAKNVENDLVNDADSDPANEIQVLSKTGNTVTLSNGGGSFNVDDADSDPANEIQTLSKTGNIVTLSKGGGSFTDAVDDADSDPANEIQTLTISGTNLTLSKGGGTVPLPSSGGGDNWGSQTASTNATLEGNGTTLNPLKIAQQGATSGQALKWNGTSWLPGTDIASGSIAAGDLGGTYPNPSVTKIQGINISTTVPANGQVLSFNGSSWSPSAISSDLNLPFSKSSSYSSTPFSIDNTGTALYTIAGYSNTGYGIYGRTNAVNSAGVLGKGSGTAFSVGVHGTSGESSTTGLPGNAGILGQSDAHLGVAGTSISGTGGYFSSSSGFALHTSGKIKLTGIGEVEGRVLTCTGTGEATWQAPTSSSSTWLQGDYCLYFNSGLVGIGTNSPNQLLEIDGKNRGQTFTHYVNDITGRSSGNGLVVGLENGYATMMNYGDSYLYLGTNSIKRMTISNIGYVGIGTLNPSCQFEIDGGPGNSIMHFVNSATGKTVDDGMTIGSFMDGNSGVYNNENKDLALGTNTITRIRIKSDGKVGIGTNTPSYLLDVAGAININKDIPNAPALYCNGSEALWYNGDYFSWGWGANWNYIGKKVYIGPDAYNPSQFMLVVNGNAAKPGGGSWTTWSDARLKDIHGNYDKGLNEIIKLQPVIFTYKAENPCHLPTDQKYVGFIAQDVQKVFPEAISEGKDGYLTLDENSINVALVNAIKELKAENDKLKAENTILKTKNENFESRLTIIERTIGASAMK